MKPKLKTTILFSALLAFFALTLPANHSEAEDTYSYAHQAEQGAWSEMFHVHHLLYLPVVRTLFRASQMAGYSGRSLPILIAFSMVCGAGVICLFLAMLRRNGGSRLWVLPLLFSYGFWRYACAAEIYLPALAVVCGAWVFASRPKGLSGAIACSAAALLLHLVCLPAVFAAGLLFAARKEWKALVLYFVSVGGIVAAVYGGVHAAVGTVVFQDASVPNDSLFVVSTWIKGVLAFGQNLLSGNFLFSISAVATRLVALFPNQMLQEELFMGQQAGWLWQSVSSVTFLGAGLLLVAITVGLVLNRSAWRSPMIVWFAGNIAMALVFEPANPEMWVFALLPFWFLVSGGGEDVSRPWNGLLPVLATMMLLHNTIGGMAFIQRKEGDYCRQKATWIVDNAAAEDVIVSADSHSFLTYVQYWSPAQVMDAKFISPEQWLRIQRRTAGRVFVFDDVLNLLPPVARRSEESVRQIRQTGELMRPGLHPVHTNELGVLYQCL